MSDTNRLSTNDIIRNLPPKASANTPDHGQHPRKNTGIVLFAGIVARAQGDSMVLSSEMADLITRLGLSDQWDRNPKAKDTYGINKSLGDIMGGHGNLYESSDRSYPRTFHLPDLTDINDTDAIAKYVKSRGLHVLSTMEQYRSARQAYEFRRRA